MSVLNIHWKDWCWRWNCNSLATWCEELTHWKRPWCWEKLKVGRKRDTRGWDGWMASPTRRTWIWVSSGSWWLEAWHAVVYGVAKHWTQLSDWTERCLAAFNEIQEMNSRTVFFRIGRVFLCYLCNLKLKFWIISKLSQATGNPNSLWRPPIMRNLTTSGDVHLNFKEFPWVLLKINIFTLNLLFLQLISKLSSSSP